jgi:hypothetical protein
MEQMSNTRRNKFFTFNGETKTIATWARTLGITQATMMYRLREWPVSLAMKPKSETKLKKLSTLLKEAATG